MARNMYGATSADFTLTAGGRVVPGATLTVWDARTGGTQVTDLLDVNSVACTTVTSGADGSVVFYGPNNEKATLWLDSGQGSRVGVRPVDITGETGATPALTIGTVTTGTAAATLTGTDEDPVLSLVLPSAGTDGVNTAAIQAKAVTAAKIADDTITATQIAANAVGSSELADNAVDTAAVADSAITTAKITDAAVTPAKLATTGRFTFPTGAANGYGFTSGASHLSGTGSPEGVVTATPGSTWLQVGDAVTVSGNLLWRKISGTGNTGWVAEGALADTGWRKIVSWTDGAQDATDQIGTVDTAQYTLSGTGSIYIRRAGQYVDWWIHGSVAKINTSGHVLFTVANLIPSGFRSDGSATYGLNAPVNSLVDFVGTNGIGDTPAFKSVAEDALMFYDAFRHYTSNPWPTSLPGVAGT